MEMLKLKLGARRGKEKEGFSEAWGWKRKWGAGFGFCMLN